MLVPRLGHGAGAQQVLGRQHARPSGRSRPARAPAAALFGKSRRTWSRSCSTATTVRFSARQRWITLHAGRPRSSGSMAANGSSSSTQVGVLQQQAREQHALELADRERVDRPALEAGEPDRLDGVLRVVRCRPVAPPCRRRRSATSGRAARCRAPRSGRSGRSRPAAAGRRCAWPRTRCGLRCAAPGRAAPCRSVLLPAPLGPTMAVISAAGISAET